MVPIKQTYYGVLDSKALGYGLDPKVRERRLMSANGVVMLDMLCAGLTPVLSENQAFDSPFLLGQIAAFDDDSTALLRLIRDGRIMPRVAVGAPGAPVPRPRAGDGPPTLLDSFAAKLDSEYVFSGWPELATREAQRELASCVYAPDKINNSKLAARLTALHELSAAAAAGPASEPLHIRPVAEGLAVRVDRALAVLTDFDRHTIELIRREMAEMTPADQNRRAIWVTALKRYEDSAPDEVAVVSAIVDLAYNIVVATSFGLPNTYQESDVPAASAAFAATNSGASGDRHVDDPSDDLENRPGLRWSDIESMLPELDSLATPSGRQGRLRAMYREKIIPREQEGSVGVSLLVAVPAMAISAMGNVVGGVAAATGAGIVAIGAPVVVTALVTVLLVLPSVANLGRRLAGAAAARRAASLTTGANSWLEGTTA